MDTVNLCIDGRRIEVPSDTTILEAARKAEIYIHTLGHHPDLPPAVNSAAAAAVYQGAQKLLNTAPEEPGRACGLCVVEVEGRNEPVEACVAQVEAGMVVATSSDRIKSTRREKLVPIMTRHRHACLVCAQQEGCSRSQCSSNVPESERCCSLFGHCELQNVANYVGLLDSTPKWMPAQLEPIKDHPLFERDYNLCIGCTRCVRACSDLRGIEAIGFVYDEQAQVQIGTLAETLEASGCKFCTACVEVCPTGALLDRAVESGTREDDLVPCRAACPAHIDVPGYLRMIAAGRADEANAVIREKVPFPGVLGRVCSHPCEAVCRRGEINEPIAICALKRFAADGENGMWKKQSRVAPGTGKKVAVVGAGPAGLTAAFYLRKKGHAVSLLDGRSQAGGMLRYGIPEYRLPRKVLAKEIQEILDLGIDFQPNQSLGEDLSLDQLKDQGFEAVFLGVGAQKTLRIPLEGCNTPDVLWGVEFLQKIAGGEKVALKDNIVVIGGGNLAVDVAMTARRCGAETVKMACLESLEEMPAGRRELEEAQAEGIQILPARGPHKIICEDGNVNGIDLVECTRVFDDRGFFCPEFSEKKECILVDQVIVAVGQAADLAFIEETAGIKISRGLIVVDQISLATGISGVYAGGDAVNLPGSVVDAVAAGRQAAESIDRALGGSGILDEVLFPRSHPDPHIGRDEGFAGRVRVKVPAIDPGIRVGSFDEIITGFSTEQAVREAQRCLQCDLRLWMGCNPASPARWLPLDDEHLQQVPETEGVYQLADGDFQIQSIKGTANLRQALLKALAEDRGAAFFGFEDDKMFTRRETELIQKYLQQHGKMPGGGEDDFDDLF